MKLTKSRLKEIIKEELKLAEQISSFHTIQRNLIDFGFGNMVVSWRGTKKKVKDFKPGNRIDNITLEKTHNTLLKNKSMRYDGNNFKVTPQGKKYFKGTLQLEGKITEGKADQSFNKIMSLLQKESRRLNDDDAYELSTKLKEWFNRHVL